MGHLHKWLSVGALMGNWYQQHSLMMDQLVVESIQQPHCEIENVQLIPGRTALLVE